MTTRPTNTAKTTSKEIQAMWQAYRDEPNAENRNRIVEQYHYLVRDAATRMQQGMPASVCADDLEQAGFFGLLDAIDSFDPALGYTFKTFCRYRIRGAMLDELRHMDFLPRNARALQRKIDKARAKLTQRQGGTTISDDQVADELGMERRKFTKRRKKLPVGGFVSLSHSAGDGDSDRERQLGQTLVDEQAVDGLEQASREDLRDYLTRSLSRAERLVITLYYYEGLTLREIAVTLGVSESRVSQIMSSVIARLKVRLSHRKAAAAIAA